MIIININLFNITLNKMLSYNVEIMKHELSAPIFILQE